MWITIEGKQVLRAVAMVMCLLIPLSIYLTLDKPEHTVETASWGLHFSRQGQPPQAPLSAEGLRKYDAAFLGDTEEKTIYLTFDCGYENGCTAGMLDVLKAQEVPAAFFVVGHYLKSAPELVCRMAEEGHIVGNHTWSHPDMSKISSEDSFLAELSQVEEEYKALTGEEMEKYYRPPQGLYSEENLAMAKRLGYRTALWSLAYVDWDQNKQMEEDKAMEILMSRVHNGAVILLHNTSETNGKILERFITACKEEGYRFGSLEELFPIDISCGEQ